LTLLKRMPAWILALSAATIVMMVVWSRYEVAYAPPGGVVLRPWSASTVDFSHNDFRKLASDQLTAERPYYKEHLVTYTLVSLDPGNHTMHFQINLDATIHNASTTKPYTFDYVIFLENSIEHYSAWVNGFDRKGEVRLVQGRRNVNFGKVSIPPSSNARIEERLLIRAPFPYHDLDITRFASMGRSVTINIPPDLNKSVRATVAPIFERTVLDGPIEQHDSDHFKYTWKTKVPGGALFPYQGFMLTFDNRT
jgi:hypothetical protein